MTKILITCVAFKHVSRLVNILVFRIRGTGKVSCSIVTNNYPQILMAVCIYIQKTTHFGGAHVSHANFQSNTRTNCTLCDVLHAVIGKSCSQAKHTAVHVLPGQKKPLQVLPRQQMPKATFSQPYMYMRD